MLKSSILKRVGLGLLIVVAVAGVSLASYIFATKDIPREYEGERNAVIVSFVQQYGTEPQILRISRPERLYVVYWQNGEDVGASMLVDGIWFDIAKQKVQGEQEQE